MAIALVLPLTLQGLRLVLILTNNDMFEDKFSDRHPILFACFIILLIMIPFFTIASLLGVGNGSLTDELGCHKTSREVYYQCRTEALLRIQIQETKKLTPNDK